MLGYSKCGKLTHMLFFSPPPPPLSSLPSWSPLPCCLIGRETLGKIVGISFHRSPRLSTRVMSCLFGIMHSRRSRSPQTPHLLLLPPLWISRSATQICVGACCCIQQPAGVLTHAGIARARANTRARAGPTNAPVRRNKFPHAAAMQVTQGGRKGSLEF